MDSNSIPVLWASSVVTGHKTTFKTVSKKVVIDAPSAVVRQILDLCDGQRNVTSLIDEVSKTWDRKSVEGLLSDLFREQVIIDGKKNTVECS